MGGGETLLGVLVLEVGGGQQGGTGALEMGMPTQQGRPQTQ